MKCKNCGQEIPVGSNFCETCGTKVPGGSYPTKNGSVVWIIITVLCGIAIVIMAVMLFNTKEDLKHAKYKWQDYYEKYEAERRAKQEASSENYSLKEFKNKVSIVYPMIINDIKIGNVNSDGIIETDFGNTLYSYNTMYLKPKVYYTGLISGSKRLKIKWIRPSGDLCTGSSSSYGYSQSASYYLSEGENEIVLAELGRADRGYWSSGTYRIEVWYNNICLKSKSFSIY